MPCSEQSQGYEGHKALRPSFSLSQAHNEPKLNWRCQQLEVKGFFPTHFSFLQTETQNHFQSQLGGAATLVRQVIEFMKVYNPEKSDLFVCTIFRQNISCSGISAFSILSVAVQVPGGVFQKICQYCDH